MSEPTDDTTMSEIQSSEGGRQPYRFRIDLPADVRSISVARRFVREALLRLDASSDDAELAVSEMFTAAVAGAAADDDSVDVEVRRRGDEVDIEVCSARGLHDLDPVQRSIMTAVADYYERRNLGDVEVQAYGYLVADRTDCAQQPDNASTIGAKASGSRTT